MVTTSNDNLSPCKPLPQLNEVELDLADILSEQVKEPFLDDELDLQSGQ